MKKQTAIYLSEYDRECIEKIKNTYGLKTNGQAIRAIIRAEAQRIAAIKK